MRACGVKHCLHSGELYAAGEEVIHLTSESGVALLFAVCGDARDESVVTKKRWRLERALNEPCSRQLLSLTRAFCSGVTARFVCVRR